MSDGLFKFLIPAAAATLLLGPAGAVIPGIGAGALSAGGAALAGGLASLALGGMGGNQSADQPAFSQPVPTAPSADPNAQAQRDEVANEERRRRAVASRSILNPTGGLGDTSTPSLSVKSLLGG